MDLTGDRPSSPATLSAGSFPFGLSSKYHLPLLICIALVARFAVFHWDQVIFSWRSTDMASIALNYYRNGLHFLSPQINWGGNGPGYVEMEFPIIPFVLALLYKIFGIQEWLALLIPMLSGLGLVVLMYLFCRRIFDPATGFIAGIFTATSPPLVDQSMALWPDPPMLLCGAIGLYFIFRWAEEDSLRPFFIGALATSLAILLKLTALYLGIPILYLCIVRHGYQLWKKPVVWLLAALILIPPLLWYTHAYELYREYHNTFGILSGGFLKLATATVLLNPAFYGLSLGRMVFYHFTPIVFVLFLFGVFRRQVDGFHYIFHAWWGAVALYLLVAARGVAIGHFQYMLPVVPPGAALAGFGTTVLLDKIGSTRVLARWSRGAWTILLTLIFLVGTVAATYVYQLPKYTTHMWNNDKKIGLEVGKLTAAGSLIIVVDNQMGGPPDGIMTPPNVFYFSDRHGWYLALSWLTEDLIEKRREEGAHYLVITGNTVDLFKESYRPIEEYLNSHYFTILSGKDGIIYDLERRRDKELTTK
ncbi:MAG TPA: glycosyltransferase family 39 protein [Bacteroidota bacterium]|nr:glycosyltransferase family 39 protein [Bacteroidota bacterium]